MPFSGAIYHNTHSPPSIPPIQSPYLLNVLGTQIPARSYHKAQRRVMSTAGHTTGYVRRSTRPFHNMVDQSQSQPIEHIVYRAVLTTQNSNPATHGTHATMVRQISASACQVVGTGSTNALDSDPCCWGGIHVLCVACIV